MGIYTPVWSDCTSQAVRRLLLSSVTATNLPATASLTTPRIVMEDELFGRSECQLEDASCDGKCCEPQVTSCCFGFSGATRGQELSLARIETRLLL